MNICMLVKAAFWMCIKIIFLKSATLSCSFTSCSWAGLVKVLHRGCCIMQFGAYGRKHKNCTNRYVILIEIQALFCQALKWLVCDKLRCLIEVIFFLLVCMPVFLCLSKIDVNIKKYFCVYCADTTLNELKLFVPYWNVCFRGFGERWLNSCFLQRINPMKVNYTIICHCFEIYLFWYICNINEITLFSLAHVLALMLEETLYYCMYF